MPRGGAGLLGVACQGISNCARVKRPTTRWLQCIKEHRPTLWQGEELGEVQGVAGGLWGWGEWVIGAEEGLNTS